jgi:hypothetical protein
LVDRDAHFRNRPERLEQQSHYGQLQHIFALKLERRSLLNPSRQSRTLLLALILEARAQLDDRYDYPVVWYEGQLGSGEVVDARTIQCAVGRIPNRQRWWIVDRTYSVGFPDYV